VQLPEGDGYNFVYTADLMITGSVFASSSSVMIHLSLRGLDMEPCIVPTESVFALHVTRQISTISLNCINRLFFENEMGFALPELED
jgi:hypothetical protein